MSASRKVFQGVRDLIDPQAAKARKEAEADLARRTAERRLDLRWMLGDARGRRIAANLLTRCHLLASTYHADARLGDQAEGRRILGLQLFSEMVTAAPEEALALFEQSPTWQAAREAAKPKDAGKT